MIALEIPARPPYLGMVRLIVGSLATDAGLSFERGQDLRLAVTEGVTAAMEGAVDGATVRLRMRETESLFEVGIGSDALTPEAISAAGVRRPLLEALCDEVSVSGVDGLSELHLSVRSSATELEADGELETSASPPVQYFPPSSPGDAGWPERPVAIDSPALVVSGERVLLKLPAAPESVAIARLAASAMASRMGFTVDEVQDLRIAVSELCSVLFGDDGGTGRLELEYAAGPGVLEVTGWGGERPRQLSQLSEQIVSFLADAYETGTAPDGRGLFRLTKRGGSA
ncbi:MAG: ATP-binding protein [Acidimicrobiia bacterium]